MQWLCAYIPAAARGDAFREIVAKAEGGNYVLTHVPAECDHLDEQALELRMLEVSTKRFAAVVDAAKNNEFINPQKKD